MKQADVRFCLRCGSPLEAQEKFGAIRPTCLRCGWIYFPDLKVAAAALVIKDGKVLLVQRANQPAQGLWTLPAGFVDSGEDPAEAAERECLEETGLIVRVTGLIDVVNGREHEHGADIVIAYRAEIVQGELRPGDDAGEAGFYPPTDLPPLAFKATRQILNKFGLD